MARTIDAQASGSDTADTGNVTVLQADTQGAITLPQGMAVGSLELTRDGQDLVLTAPDGRVLVVDDYFLGTTPPHITSADGAQLSPQLVQSFLTNAGDVRVAANEQMNDASPVGDVAEVSGAATVIRADGTRETITLGTDIHQGDIIETAEDGAVNIKFSDDSSFAISQNARLAIDEYSFNADDQSGSTSLSVLRGVFMFTSGLIGRENPDQVHLETPVGSIGIRGTIIGGHIAEAGSQSQISVIEGAIVVRNGTGEHILSTQFETVQLTSYNSEIKNVGVLDTVGVTNSYGAVRSVTPTLFSSIDDTARDQSPAQEAAPQAKQPEEIISPTQEERLQNKQPSTPDAPAKEERPQVQNEPRADADMLQTISMDKITAADMRVDARTEIMEMRTAIADSKIAGLSGAPQGLLSKPEDWLERQEMRDMRAPSSLRFAANGEVDENATTGIAGRVIQDAPIRANVTYGFAPGGNAGGLFVIDPLTGLIRVNGTIGNYDDGLRDYDVTVRVTNTENGRFTDTTLSIDVNNINEAPLSVALAAGLRGDLHENVSSAIVIQNLDIDNDGSGNTPYTFKVYDYDGGIRGAVNPNFVVEESSGTYRLVKDAGASLNYETKDTYNLVVGITEDGFGEVFSAPITLSVINNPAPIIVTDNTTEIDEGATIFLTTGDLESTDAGTDASNIIYTVSKASITSGQLLGATDAGLNYTFTQAEVNTGTTISFEHDGNEEANASFNYTVSDGHETTALQEFNFTNNRNVNDNSVQVGDLTTIYDATDGRPEQVTITRYDLGYTDIDGSVYYKVTTLPTAGILKLDNGTSLVNVYINVTVITQSDIDAGKLIFVPTDSGTTSFSFNFNVYDSKHNTVNLSNTLNIEFTNTPDYADDFNFNNASGINNVANSTHGAHIGILNDTSAETYDASHYRILSIDTYAMHINNFEIVNMPDGRIAIKAKDNFASFASGIHRFEIAFDHQDNGVTGDLTKTFEVDFRSDTLTLEDLRNPLATRGFVIENTTHADGKTGTAVAMGDFNNDGKFDILTGTPYAESNDGGMLSVQTGGTTPILNISGSSDTRLNMSNPSPGAKYGSQIAVLGHFDTSMGANGTAAFDKPREYLDIATTAPGIGEIRIDSFYNDNDAALLKLHDSYTITNVPTGVDTGPNAIRISSAGDVNRDGFDDLLIGTQYENNQGSATLIYGSATRNIGEGNASVTWSSLIQTPSANVGFFNNQFLTGNTANNASGAAVAGLGDVNRDGYSDFAVSSLTGSGNGSNQGMVNVFFGKSGHTLEAADTTIIRGVADRTGFANNIASAGDVNSNGRSDLLIQDLGRRSVWLVDGGAIARNIDFQIDNPSITGKRTEINWDAGDTTYHIGQVMTQAGNFNGDELDDYVVSASRMVDSGKYEHTLFVIYGTEVIPSTLSLSSLLNNQTAAYKIKLAETSSLDITATGGGDINGDGYDDIIVGTPSAFGDKGASVVVYGNNSSGAVTGGLIFNGNNQSRVGDSGENTFINTPANGANGYTDPGDYQRTDGYYNSSVMGGAGNDTYITKNENFVYTGAGGPENYMFKKFDGGGGFDTLKIAHDSGQEGDTLNLTGISDHMFNVERIEISKSGVADDRVALSLRDVLTLISDSDALTTDGLKKFEISLYDTESTGTPELLIQQPGFTNTSLNNIKNTDIDDDYTVYTFDVGQLWVHTGITVSTVPTFTDT